MKNKRGGSRDNRRHQQEYSRRSTPHGVLVVECDDPACGARPGQVIIHHLGAHGQQPAPERERPGATNSGPFSDSSDLDSEGAPGAHDTHPC